MMKGMGWYESRHIDAASYLLRDLAHRKNVEYHGLFYYEDRVYHPRRNRFRPGVRGLQLLHERRNNDDSGDHWVLADRNEDQLFIYDSARQKQPRIIGLMLDKLKNLVPGERGTKITAFYPKVQLQNNGYDCGPHAIAFAVKLINANVVSTTNFNKQTLRPHLVNAFETLHLNSFPTTGGRPRVAATNEVVATFTL